MRKSTSLLLTVLGVVVLLLACSSSSKSTSGPNDAFDVSFTLPASVDVTLGGTCVFEVKDGKAPLTSDSFVLESESGVSYLCPIIASSSQEFSVQLSTECVAGSYNVFIKRDQRRKSFGRLYLNIVEELPDDFTPDAGTTVYGRITAGDRKSVV